MKLPKLIPALYEIRKLEMSCLSPFYGWSNENGEWRQVLTTQNSLSKEMLNEIAGRCNLYDELIAACEAAAVLGTLAETHGREKVLRMLDAILAKAKTFDPLITTRRSNMRDDTVRTTNKEVFTSNEHYDLARLIYKRFGRNPESAAKAWSRMLENNCTVDEYMALVNAPTHTYHCEGYCSFITGSVTRDRVCPVHPKVMT